MRTRPDLATPSIDFVQLDPTDNIVVAARHLAAGTVLPIHGDSVELTASVRMGHKVAVRPIDRGARVLKFGQSIGVSTQAISPGDWVHSHNLVSEDFRRDYELATAVPPAPPPITGRTFLGYRRSDGRVGTRNYVAVISTVNCSASVSKYIAERFPREALRAHPQIDGVVAFRHEGGCGMQFGGLRHAMLNRVLGGIARHPNIGAYVLVGLGCEQGTMEYLLDDQKLVQIDGAGGGRRTPPVLVMQSLGGTVRTVEAGVEHVARILPLANAVRREPVPASELILATECGGSDGNSGVTANPAVGVASDMVVASGGTVILSETPEIFGAEHLLTRRARSAEVARKLLERIEWWKWYVGLFGAELDNNPSAGNKEGGLTTIAEKSLGAVAKAGSTALEAVYEYAEPIRSKGLVVMDSPGFDPPSVTGMVAGGANLVVFTTGRGSCYGCKPVPSLKVATNTPMFQHLSDDMDLNAGAILEGRSVADVGREIFEMLLAVASGQPTKSEIHGMGDEEFVPWTVGPTL